MSSPRACQLPGASCHRLTADMKFSFSPNDSEHRRHGTSCCRFTAGMEFSFSSRGSQHRRHDDQLLPTRRRGVLILVYMLPSSSAWRSAVTVLSPARGPHSRLSVLIAAGMAISWCRFAAGVEFSFSVKGSPRGRHDNAIDGLRFGTTMTTAMMMTMTTMTMMIRC